MFWHVLGTHINPGCLLRGPMAEHIFGHDMPTFGRIRCACFHRNPLLPSKCGGVSRLPLEKDEATVVSTYPQVGDLEICLADPNLANNLLIYLSVFAIYVLHNFPNIHLLHHVGNSIHILSFHVGNQHSLGALGYAANEAVPRAVLCRGDGSQL